MKCSWKHITFKFRDSLHYQCFLGCLNQNATLLLTGTGNGFASRCEEDDKSGVARLWEPLSGKAVSPLIKHKGGLTEVAFSDDGSAFLTAGCDARLLIHDTCSKKQVQEVKCHSIPTSAMFLPDSLDVLYGSMNGGLILSHQMKSTILATKLSRKRMEMKLSPGRKWLAVMSGVQVVIISLKSLKILQILKHRLRVTCMDWLDDHTIITASDDYQIRKWNLASSKSDILYSTPRWIWTLLVSQDKTRILIGTEDNMLGPDHLGHARVISAQTGQPVSEMMVHQGTVLAEFFDEESQVVTVGTDFLVKVWDWKQNKSVKQWKLNYMMTFLLAPSNARFFAVSTGYEMHVFSKYKAN